MIAVLPSMIHPKQPFSDGLGGLLKNKKRKSPVNLAIYRTLCGERGILYHSTIFCNSLIFKFRLQAFSLILHEKWRRTGARQNVLKHCVCMTFVIQFNYFKKSIDSIFYSTPQIFEEIMALRHSLLTLNKSVAIVFYLSSHSLCIMFMNCPYERGIILHHDHYLTIIIQMPISQI